MFNVGDLVKVVKFGSAHPSTLGKKGVVRSVEPRCIGVDLEGEDTDWYYSEDEIEVVSSPNESSTLLDQFAMAALTGLVSRLDTPFEYHARAAYELAQAMMKARPQ